MIIPGLAVVVASLAIGLQQMQDSSNVRVAPEQGDAEAQFQLGDTNGDEVPRNDAEAKNWYRKAARLGSVDAEDVLATLEVVKWYRLAAEQGDAEAQFQLGKMYANGDGVARDDAEAVKWYRKAAEQGDAGAQFVLGEMYTKGQGVPRNNTEAAKWFKKSNEQPTREGRTSYHREKIMTVDEALARLKSANIAFNTPDRARVGTSFVVEAKLSTQLTREVLKIFIEENGKIEAARLKVSNRMIATLAGGSSFDVSPSGPQEQWVSEVEPTGWLWQVNPKTAGNNQVLILSLDALININGKDDRRTINTFKRRIDVDVGWPETVGEWLDLIKKTGENISWIWVTVLIPVGGSIWAWAKRRRWISEPRAPGTAPPSERRPQNE